jgi:hypothetical protein
MGRSLLQTFGSNFVKCYTFHIVKQQFTTLSRTVQLKDSTATSRMHFAHGLQQRLGPRSYLLYSSASVHSREETLDFPRLRHFLALQLSCPMNFHKEMNFSVDTIVKKSKKTLDAPPFSLPRHNSSTQLPTELPDELLRAPSFWLRHGGVIPPLHRPYDCPYEGPYAVLRWASCSFTIRVGSRDEVVSISHLKACREADATPGSPRCRS